MRKVLIATPLLLVIVVCVSFPASGQVPCFTRACDPPEPPQPPPPGPSQGFTSSSSVTQLDANTFLIAAEVLFNEGGPVTEFTLPFSLPPNKTITALQGTLSYKGPTCFAEALGQISVDGKLYAMITKLTATGGSTNIFLNYSVPLSYGTGNAQILVGNGQTCTTTMASQNRTTWEFQGLLRVQ